MARVRRKRVEEGFELPLDLGNQLHHADGGLHHHLCGNRSAIDGAFDAASMPIAGHTTGESVAVQKSNAPVGQPRRAWGPSNHEALLERLDVDDEGPASCHATCSGRKMPLWRQCASRTAPCHSPITSLGIARANGLGLRVEVVRILPGGQRDACILHALPRRPRGRCPTP